jgi:hypothetical protein
MTVKMQTEPARAGSELPSWFDANRVQGHTRLGLGKYEPPPPPPRYWYGTDEFNQAAAGFKELGAGAFTRHVKSGSEDPWWPTALPIDPDGVVHSDRPRDINGIILEPGQNVAKTIIDEAHEQGLRIIAYYWDASEATVAALRDDWVCRRPHHGKELKSPRRVQLDLTGPYREVVRTRLLELAEMGADGFFFDSRHIHRAGCWGTALEAAWTAETGEDAPPLPKPDEEPSPRYLEFLDFRANKIEETFAYWRDEVKSRHRDVVFVISTDDFAALIDRGVTTRLARIADSAKNEYCQAVHNKVTRDLFEAKRGVLKKPRGHVRQSLGWTILRDSSQGRPPHIWHPGVPTEEQAEALAASLLTFGAVANMDVYERSLCTKEDQQGKTPVAGLKRAFALGKLVSPHLARAQPLRWAAVHFGEHSRNQRGTNYLAMWQQVLWPLVGPYKVLTEDGLPIGIVNDEQLEQGELDDYSVLILPNPNELTAGQADTVAAFTARQGTIIENNPAWAWSDPAASDAAAAAFRAVLQPHLATAPVHVTGGPAGATRSATESPDGCSSRSPTTSAGFSSRPCLSRSSRRTLSQRRRRRQASMSPGERASARTTNRATSLRRTGCTRSRSSATDQSPCTRSAAATESNYQSSSSWRCWLSQSQDHPLVGSTPPRRQQPSDDRYSPHARRGVAWSPSPASAIIACDDRRKPSGCGASTCD